MTFYYRDLENWLRGLSRSLKLVPFKSSGAVSYSPSIVTMAVSVDVCDIFSVKEWPNLEIWVCGPSKSLVRHCNYRSILYHLRVI